MSTKPRRIRVRVDHLDQSDEYEIRFFFAGKRWCAERLFDSREHAQRITNKLQVVFDRGQR